MVSPDDPKEPMRVGGHHSDFDELSWHLTYRAAKAAQDLELPQSEAEAKFVKQMLGEEPIDPSQFPFGSRHAVEVEANNHRAAAKVLLVAFIGALLVIMIPILINLAMRPQPLVAPTPTITETPAPSPTATAPVYTLAPYDRKGVDVIAEMLAIAAEANPGLIWLTSQTPELTSCTMPNGQDGQVATLTVRWTMGDYAAINEPDVDRGINHWRLIQQANDAADDRFIEAWMGHPIDDQSPVDPLHGNWYFGYVFPGISGGESKFDTENGEGILSLETLCLQPASVSPND